MIRDMFPPTTPHASIARGERSPTNTKIGSLEQRASLARKTMPHIHPPGACIAVLAGGDAEGRSMIAWLADDFTSVVQLPTPAELDELKCRPDVIIVARALLRDSGLMLRRIRQRRLTAILVVTGAFDLMDVEHLLDAGADDAIPEGSPELRSRLRAAARRARALNASMRIAVGDIMYNRESRRVWCANTEVRLTRTEESLLDCLFWYTPRPATIAELTDFAWRGEVTTERRNLVHVYIGYLRRKLSPSRQMIIRTVRGTGYELVARQDDVARA